MTRSWSDNDGVTALSRAADSLAALAEAIPARGQVAPSIDTSAAELPIQNLPAHVRFARIWEQRRASVLASAESRRCPLCGAAESRTWFLTQDGYRYDICDQCRMIYIPEVVPMAAWDRYFADIPDAREHLRSQMAATITVDALDAHRVRFSRYFELIERHGAALRGARLLDIGTYTGGALKIAAERSLEPEGVEGLEEAVQFCRAHRPELRVTLGHAEALPEPVRRQGFDLVTMWETLEHTFDPMRALAGAWQALKAGGLLGLTVPNGRNVQCSVLRDYCFFAYGGYQGIGHVNLFTPETLADVLDRSGFDLVYLETEFSTDWRQMAYYLQLRFERIYCYRNLVRHGEFTRNPEPSLGVILNWLSPALTRIENALQAGPIAFALARKRPR
ncbi:MAG: Methyltransferase type 12 [Acidobacteria bacterium]|nr:Methyltransferase type 12 [Acidobacteriota bacterium]